MLKVGYVLELSVWVGVGIGFRGGGRTFGCVRGLVVLGEPLQVLILHPRHPRVVLPVVELPRLLLVRLRLCGLVLVGRHVVFLSFLLEIR